MSEISNIDFDAIFSAYDEQEPLMATVLELTGTGFNVDVLGMECFMPGSETADRNNVKVGDSLEVMVLKVNAAKANLIVSNRAVVEMRAEQLAQKAMEEMQVGDIVQGVVKNITNYGVFVSVGPVDGLVHINEMSWEKINDINAVVKVGDIINVKVIGIEERKGTKKLALSVKQCQADPWSEIKEADYVGHILECTVSQIVSYGVFVSIGRVNGLIHESEMSWAPESRKVKPADIFSVGDKVMAKVISCDVENHKIALSTKALQPDPWDALTDDMIGKDYEVTVVSTAKFGLFAEILPNVEGLIHVSDLSWSKVIDASEFASVGDKIKVRLEEINRAKRRIVLNHKVLVPNPWADMNPMMYVGRIYDGVVTRIKDGVVYVRFAPELVGRLRNGEVDPESLKVGDKIKVSPDFVDIKKKAIFLKLL